MNSATWSVARWWSTPGRLEGIRLEPDTTRIILGVQGTATVEIERSRLVLAPDKLLLVPGDTALQTTNDMLWARTEWHLRTPALMHRTIRAHTSTPLEISAPHRSLITATTNVLSTSPHLSGALSAAPLLDVLTGVVVSAVSDAQRTYTHMTPVQNELIRSAAEIIDQRYLDPRFGVTELAESANVSTRYLRRIFALIDTTPHSEIERRRVAAAESILALAPAHDGRRLEDAALRVGFTSARQLRRAIDRQAASRTSFRSIAHESPE